MATDMKRPCWMYRVGCGAFLAAIRTTGHMHICFPVEILHGEGGLR